MWVKLYFVCKITPYAKLDIICNIKALNHIVTNMRYAHIPNQKFCLSHSWMKSEVKSFICEYLFWKTQHKSFRDQPVMAEGHPKTVTPVDCKKCFCHFLTFKVCLSIWQDVIWIKKWCRINENVIFVFLGLQYGSTKPIHTKISKKHFRAFFSTSPKNALWCTTMQCNVL